MNRAQPSRSSRVYAITGIAAGLTNAQLKGDLMKHKSIATLIAAAAMAVSTFAATTATKPKITMEQARAIALKKAPGTIKSAELENEHGKLIYSFDIATSPKAITEVNVDALNGKIVAVQHENAAKEAAEKKHEAKDNAAKH